MCLPSGIRQFGSSDRGVLTNRQFQDLYRLPNDLIAIGTTRVDLVAPGINVSNARRCDIVGDLSWSSVAETLSTVIIDQARYHLRNLIQFGLQLINAERRS